MNIKEQIKRFFSEDYYNNPSFLRGIIIDKDNTIKRLQKENKELRNKQGVWLSPEDIEEIKGNLTYYLETRE